MKFETPKVDPKRRAELETSRTLEAAELLKGDAEFVPNKEGIPELIATEEQKTAAEKEMGKDFYERHQGSKEEITRLQNREAEQSQRLTIQREVNGVEISVGWSPVRNNCYEIAFPNLKTDKFDSADESEGGSSQETEEEKIFDNYLYLSDDKEMAMDTYEYAVSLARTGKSVREVYRGVQQFVNEKR